MISEILHWVMYQNILDCQLIYLLVTSLSFHVIVSLY